MSEIILRWAKGELSEKDFTDAYWAGKIPDFSKRKPLMEMNQEELDAELKFFVWLDKLIGPFDDYSQREEIKRLISLFDVRPLPLDLLGQSRGAVFFRPNKNKRAECCICEDSAEFEVTCDGDHPGFPDEWQRPMSCCTKEKCKRKVVDDFDRRVK